MKTIEERAKIYAQKAIEYACGRRFGEPNYITNLFIEMATEQRKIDIEKACLTYEKELRQMKRILNEVKVGAGELISVGGSLIQFKKAMEK